MALRLFLVLACTFLLLTSREQPWADAHVVYDTAQALVERGEINITLDGPPQFFAHHGGKKYGVFPLGNVLAMVPSYLAYKALFQTNLFPERPLYALCSHLSPALLMAAAGVVFYRILKWRGAATRLAAILTLGFGLSTIGFSYARVPYSEALQTLSLLLLVGATLRAGERLSGEEMVRVGIYAGVFFNSKLVNALLLPLFPLYIGWRQHAALSNAGERLRTVFLRLIGPFALGLLAFIPFVGLALAHNQIKTGSIWNTGYKIPNGVFSGDLWAGLYSFLLSTGKSVFLYSPPLVLVPFALGTAWQKKRAETTLLLAILGVAFLWNAKFRHWHGDYCWGPRHLVPFVPVALLLLIPWLAEALGRGQIRLRRALLAALFVLGFGVQLLGAAFYWDHYIRILIAVKDQTGAPGWFQEQLGHGHYMPQFSPLRGHLWLLMHKLRGDPELSRDTPWKLLVPQPVDLHPQYAALRFDWWLLDFVAPQPVKKPWALPLALAPLLTGLFIGAHGMKRRLAGPRAAKKDAD